MSLNLQKLRYEPRVHDADEPEVAAAELRAEPAKANAEPDDDALDFAPLTRRRGHSEHDTFVPSPATLAQPAPSSPFGVPPKEEGFFAGVMTKLMDIGSNYFHSSHDIDINTWSPLDAIGLGV